MQATEICRVHAIPYPEWFCGDAIFEDLKSVNPVQRREADNLRDAFGCGRMRRGMKGGASPHQAQGVSQSLRGVREAKGKVDKERETSQGETTTSQSKEQPTQHSMRLEGYSVRDVRRWDGGERFKWRAERRSRSHMERVAGGVSSDWQAVCAICKRSLQ